MAAQRLSAWLGLVLLALASCTSQQAPTDPATASKGVDSTAMKTSAASVSDDPAAHALYNQMIAAMLKYNTLSYVSRYELEEDDKGKRQGCTYRVWLKKPNYFRVETESNVGEKGGVLIGDGNTAWVYWPHGRPKSTFEESEDYEKVRLTSYMNEPTPLGRYSIGHKTGRLGVKMLMPIIDPSIFHGYTIPFQSHLDGIRSLGTQKVGTEECDEIEVSMVKHQRSWRLWLSKSDHLPRRLKEVLRAARDMVTNEEWSSVAIDGEIPQTLFAWKPPKGWTRWTPLPLEAGLLKPGTEAPDFDLASADGKRIRLSDYRGQIVWLCMWKVGCPACCKQLPYRQEQYLRYKSKGVVILGFNCIDDKQTALDKIRASHIAFPNIVDSSDAAERICFEVYQRKGRSATPLNYIINREGRVTDAWYGYEQRETRGEITLQGLGVEP